MTSFIARHTRSEPPAVVPKAMEGTIDTSQMTAERPMPPLKPKRLMPAPAETRMPTEGTSDRDSSFSGRLRRAPTQTRSSAPARMKKTTGTKTTTTVFSIAKRL